MSSIPLFPLNTVLYPHGRLPLRIFEPRYLDMVSDCMKTDSGFGVCLIKQGAETGPAATCFNTGTYAEIIDFLAPARRPVDHYLAGETTLQGVADGGQEQ